MEKKESIYSEVVIDFYNDIDHEWNIDTWKTPDSWEEGVTAGKINLKGEIKWVVEEAKNDPLVKEEVERFLYNKAFSAYTHEKFAEVLNNNVFSNSPSVGSFFEINVYSKDGETTYNIEKIRILNDCIRYAVGMSGIDDFKLFTIDKEGVEEAIDYLIQDITQAVGDTFAISIE